MVCESEHVVGEGVCGPGESVGSLREGVESVRVGGHGQ